ncbi:UNVERIFIED_CONTAM: Fatty acyl-CoA reductase 2 [Sesamum calycinum]|uniref:Fatty acyl-CoA reductase n=1 Tax=Sesamum calycinum TaxID=2727403 RepID=A0AAW2LSG7_9LAMI
MNATTTNVAELPKTTNDSAGIGILNFFQGKNIFITGATGFLGKALVEKLLRSTAVGKIYVLIKAEDKAAAFDRLRTEIINSELFKCLKEEHGASYEAFVRERLIPAVGNICEPELGMDVDTANTIMNEVDVIIQSAANTAFDDRYDSLLEANVNGPQRLMRFAKRCNNLILFVHISTGHLPAVLGDLEVKLDVIPVDMVVNTIIAATAKHGIRRRPGLDVYHSASAIVNPLRYYDVFEFSYEYFNSNPLIESSSKDSNVKKIKFFDNFNDLSKYTRDEICQGGGLQLDAVDINEKIEILRKQQRKWKAKFLHAIQLCKIYEFSGFYRGRYGYPNRNVN